MSELKAFYFVEKKEYGHWWNRHCRMVATSEMVTEAARAWGGDENLVLDKRCLLKRGHKSGHTFALKWLEWP